MRAADERRKRAEKGGTHWIQTVMWGIFLSAIMFGLGFLAGSRWGAQRTAELITPPVTRLMPPSVEIFPPTQGETGAPEEEANGRVWGILTRNEDTTSTEKATLVPPKKEAAAPSAVPSTSSVPASQQGATALYCVQVGASKDPQKAQDLMKELRKKGYPSPRVLKADIQGRGIWYRIRVGSFRRKTQAEELAWKIRQRERLDPRVMLEKSQNP